MGRPATLANVDGTAILAYGPGDIAYLTRQGTTIEEFAVVAVPLSGDNAGSPVATQPANINLFLEYPPLSFGHGPDGVIHRRQYVAGTAVAPYVDIDGKPITLDTAPATFVFDDDVEHSIGGVIQSSTGMSWTLAVEAEQPTAPTPTSVFRHPQPGPTDTVCTPPISVPTPPLTPTSVNPQCGWSPNSTQTAHQRGGHYQTDGRSSPVTPGGPS